jgi:hypothetical protein
MSMFVVSFAHPSPQTRPSVKHLRYFIAADSERLSEESARTVTVTNLRKL